MAGEPLVTLTWDCIDYDRPGKLLVERAPVHGGWLVRSLQETPEGTWVNPSITFIPDPQHEWVPETEERA